MYIVLGRSWKEILRHGFQFPKVTLRLLTQEIDTESSWVTLLPE